MKRVIASSKVQASAPTVTKEDLEKARNGLTNAQFQKVMDLEDKLRDLYNFLDDPDFDDGQPCARYLNNPNLWEEIADNLRFLETNF
jgi:hypothetical protein